MAASSGPRAAVCQQSFPLSPREVGLAGMITLLGIALRWGGVSQVALAHFDEGVYASNVWFGPESDYAYPARHLYAPPLVPALIELSISLGGATGSAPLLPGLICGCLLVPLVWWVGRQWFGPAAGLLAGTLAALSGPHSYFSRTALTDAPLCLFLTAAVYLGGEWIQRGGSRRWFAAAGCAALAWWTKYNGWLPLAIWSSAVVPWLLFRPGGLAARAAFEPVSRETNPHLDGPASWTDRDDPVIGRIPRGGSQPEEASKPTQSGWQAVPKPAPHAIAVTRAAPVSRETTVGGVQGGGVSRETAINVHSSAPRVESVSRETGPTSPACDLAPALDNGESVSHPVQRVFTPPPSAPLASGPAVSGPTGLADAVSRGTALRPTPAASTSTSSENQNTVGVGSDGFAPESVTRPSSTAPGGSAGLADAVSRGTARASTAAATTGISSLDPITAGDGCGQAATPGTDGSNGAGIAGTLPSNLDGAIWQCEPTGAGSAETPAPGTNLACVSRETSAPPATRSTEATEGECDLAPTVADQSQEELPHVEQAVHLAAIASPGNDAGRESADSIGSRIAEQSSSPQAAEVALSGVKGFDHGSVPRETSDTPALGRVVWRVALLLTLAVGLWLPCLWGLESVGGYSVVAANHRRYLVGWSGMAASVVRQFEALMFLEDFPSRIAWLLGLTLLWINAPRRSVPVWGWSLLATGGLCFGTLPITCLAAIALLVCLVRRAGWSRWREFPVWLLLAWWVSLTIATPGYTPYPRLTLPWLVASWLVAGAWVAGWLMSKTDSHTPIRAGSQSWLGRLGAVGLLLVAALATSRVWQRDWLLGHPQRGLADGARQVVEAIQQSLAISHEQPIDALIYVHAEPALVFHLRAHGLPVVQPVQDLEFTRKPGVDRAPTFVILGDRSRHEPGLQGPPAGDARWRPVAQLELAVPPLVWLDEAWQPVTDGGLDRLYHLEVWRVGSAPNP